MNISIYHIYTRFIIHKNIAMHTENPVCMSVCSNVCEGGYVRYCDNNDRYALK